MSEVLRVHTKRLIPHIFFGQSAQGATIQIEDCFFKIVSVKRLEEGQELILTPLRTISNKNFKVRN